jgi:hypothetical protein
MCNAMYCICVDDQMTILGSLQKGMYIIISSIRRSVLILLLASKLQQQSLLR